MYYVCLLQSLKSSFYIGYTNDLKRKFAEHNNGESKAAKSKKPYILIFYEAFINANDAKAREEYLKSGWGRRSINKILKNYLKNNNFEAE